MKRRFLLYRRKRGGMYYLEDTESRKQESLGTRDRTEAMSLLNARNESVRQPHLNLEIAKAYLAGTDSGVATRTWQNALDALIETKRGSTQERWRRAAKETALDWIRDRVIIQTQAEHLLACLKAGTVSTNVHLRKLHNFCLSMNWLPWPIIPKRLWPEVRFQPKRAITLEEHRLIIDREKNPERRAFYELCWHLGGSQSDIAHLQAEDIDWLKQTIAYARQKTGSLAMIHFGPEIEAVLRRLPTTGPLFPYLQSVRSGDRATEFKQRCEGLGIKGVSLHSYRYAWAERAKQCGYPERFAQEALGHNSKAVHRAYARQAKVKLPSLESFEKQASGVNVIAFPTGPAVVSTPPAQSAQSARQPVESPG
jgi:integrase